MTFQTTVTGDQATGVIGEIIFDGPNRTRPLNVDSAGVTPNTIGNAFTYVTGKDEEAYAGSGGGGAFAGILVNPKSYASYGATTGTLDPTIDLPDNTNAELMTMGTIIVNLTVIESGVIGAGVFYVDATGALGAGTAGVGQTQITNAKVDRRIIAAPGLGIITLTEAG